MSLNWDGTIYKKKCCESDPKSVELSFVILLGCGLLFENLSDFFKFMVVVIILGMNRPLDLWTI